MNKEHLTLPALALLVIAASAFIFLQPKVGAFGSTHEHADFAVFINGEKIDFSQAKYQTKLPDDPTACGDTSKLAHLHAGKGNIAHKHATGVTWQYFFSTLNITLEKNCITIGNYDNLLCSNKESKLRFMENGKEVDELGEIKDLSKVLISYGSENLTQQLTHVTDEAKLQSKGASCAGEGSHPASQGNFNSTLFSDEYFKAIKITFSRNLTTEDMLPLTQAIEGGSKEAVEEIDEAEWFVQKNLAEHAVHSVNQAYEIAVKNSTPYCLPHEADHVFYYAKFNEEQRIRHSAGHLPELLPEYENAVKKYLNVSKTYAAIDLNQVKEKANSLTQLLNQGKYYSQEAQEAIEFLRKQPC